MEAIIEAEMIIKKQGQGIEIERRLREIIFRKMDVIAYMPFFKVRFTDFSDMVVADVEVRLFPVKPNTETLEGIAKIIDVVFREVEKMIREGKRSGKVEKQLFTDPKLFP